LYNILRHYTGEKNQYKGQCEPQNCCEPSQALREFFAHENTPLKRKTKTIVLKWAPGRPMNR
jgi:hypothetical protein